MSHWEHCAHAQETWAQKLSRDEELSARWAELQSALLGPSDGQADAAAEVARLSLWDAACSLLSAVEGRPLRLAAGLRASDRLSTAVTLAGLARTAPPAHALRGLLDSRLLERFLLQSATKAQPDAMPGASRDELLSISRRMVSIPAGDYWIGSARHSEGPVHRVQLPGFQVGVFPVTQALWALVQRKNPSKYQGASRPVDSVGWWDALRFCNALSESEGLEPFYRIERNDRAQPVEGADGYRLLSEAEWEVAARARPPGRRLLSPDEILSPPLGPSYAGGDDVSVVGWCLQNTGTRPIGQKEPNGNGIYDLSGNVFEWVWDWFGPYAPLLDEKKRRRGEQLFPYFQRKAAALDGASSGSYRCYRGGSWSTSHDYARSAARMANVPTLRSPCVGFRLARG